MNVVSQNFGEELARFGLGLITLKGEGLLSWSSVLLSMANVDNEHTEVV
jgi:hypothetical protein